MKFILSSVTRHIPDDPRVYVRGLIFQLENGSIYTRTEHLLDLASLEELLAFAQSIDEELIISTDKGMPAQLPSIHIYDDYIE